MRAVTYLRVSTDRQAEKDLSIPAQRQAVQAWAAAHDCEIVQEFTDEGESARTANRPAFLEMVAFCRQTAGIDAVLVYHLDRFSRSRLDHAVYKNLLRKAGVRTISATVTLDDTPESIILEGVLETFSEYYSANLSRVISRGMRQAVEAKRSRPGGTIPYGYQSVRVDRRVTLEIVPAEAATVRRMAELALQGQDLGAIGRILDGEGLRNRDGRRFQKSQLQRIFHGAALVGDLVWNRQRHGKGAVLKPADAWLTVRDAWPAILDRETFARIQEVLAMRAPTNTRRRLPSSDYLLTGFLICGQCGAGYTVEQAKGGRYRYYQCGRTMKEGISACPGRRLPMATTDRASLKGILDVLFDERELARIAVWAGKEAGVDRQGLEKQQRELDRWETGLGLRRERLLDALEAGKIEAGLLTGRLARLDEEKATLAAKRAALDQAKLQAEAVPTVELFREYGQELRRKAEAGPVQATKLLLRHFVRRVVVGKDTLKAELVIGKPRNSSGSRDEFALSNGWWTNRDHGGKDSRPFRITIRVA